MSATSTVQAIAVGGPSSLSASAIYAFNNTAASLTVTGDEPFTMTCSVTGLAEFGSSGPTGSVTFTDTATAQTLGMAALGAASASAQLQYVDNNLGLPGGGDISGDCGF